MKRIFLSSLISLSLAQLIQSQNVVNVSGNITANTTWTNNNIYRLNGIVRVQEPAVLTIEKGTVIRGVTNTSTGEKGVLLIERGAKIVAIGTPAEPIVFTSDQAPGNRSYGDWGGLVICGRASCNLPGGEGVLEGGYGAQFGGGLTPNDDDSSGALKYVRIEFTGWPIQPNQEINGLTLGAVGRKTLLEYIQVSYCGDDSYEWFGGTVNAKHLVAFRGWDDEFDIDNGYTGKLQFIVSLRDPAVADQSGSNGFEIDNDGQATSNTPFTSPVISNATIIGPASTIGTTVNAQYQRAIHFRRNSQPKLYNSVLTGYPRGFHLDGNGCETWATQGDLQLRQTYLGGILNPNLYLVVNSGSTFDIQSFFHTSGWNNRIYQTMDSLMLTNPNNLTGPDFRPMTGSPLLGSADFSNPNLQDPFFESVTYRGAFGSTDWTECWTSWNPQMEDYSKAVNYNPQAAFTFQNLPFGGVSFTNTSSNATSFQWNFGDGSTSTDENPVHFYNSNNTFTVTLTATSPCGTSTTTATVTVTNWGVEDAAATYSHSLLFPNPAVDVMTVHLVSAARAHNASVQVISQSGQVVDAFNVALSEGANTFQYDTHKLSSGVYFLKIGAHTTRFAVIR
ncbi:MAG: PKD domain-containing protein [Flavobacteriales bacterium]|nr:PKD domain-containing protein [Flavobacteriales bacterium]